MSTEQMAKWTEERRIDHEISKLVRIAGESAARYMGSTDLAEECCSECVVEKLYSWYTTDFRRSIGSEDELKDEMDHLSRQYSYRRMRRRRKEVLVSEVPGIENIASREPGPEAIVHCADLLSRLLNPLPILLPSQQRLFVERILKERRLIDLERETGRSADALCKAIKRTLDRLRGYLAGTMFSEDEIQDYLRLLNDLRQSA